MAFRIINTIFLVLKFIIKNKYLFCFDIKRNYWQKEIYSNFAQVTLWSFKILAGKELKEQNQTNDPPPLPYLNKNVSKCLLQFFLRGEAAFLLWQCIKIQIITLKFMMRVLLQNLAFQRSGQLLKFNWNYIKKLCFHVLSKPKCLPWKRITAYIWSMETGTPQKWVFQRKRIISV